MTEDRASVDRRGFRDRMAHRVQEEKRGQQALRGRRGQPERQVRRGPVEQPGQLVHKERPVLQARWDLAVLPAQRAQLDRRDQPALRE